MQVLPLGVCLVRSSPNRINSLQDIQRPKPWKQGHSQDHLSKYAPHRPHVTGWSIKLSAQDDLRRSIQVRERILTHLIFTTKLLCHTEIDQLETSLLRKHYVIRLQIPVHYEIDVHRLHSFDQLIRQVFNVLRLQQNIWFQKTKERTALQKLDNDARRPILQLKYIIQLTDVRIVNTSELLQNVDFSQLLEVVALRFVLRLFLVALDCNLFACLGVSGQIGGRIHTFTKFFLKLVAIIKQHF